CSLTLERVIGPTDSTEFNVKTYYYMIAISHELCTKHARKESCLDESILHECLKTMESNLDKSAAKKALEKFYTEDSDLVDLLLSSSNENLSAEYGTRLLKFFNKLFQLAEKNSNDKSYETLCSSLGKLTTVSADKLQTWLARIIKDTEQGGKVQENRLLLQGLTSYIVKENSHVNEDISATLLKAILPMGSQLLDSVGTGFSELMVVMATLAGAGSGSGHLELFKAATDWLEECKKYLGHKDVVEKIEANVTEGKVCGKRGQLFMYIPAYHCSF
ncbi:E3 ubiquitin-protein ligase UBR4-like, partial [Saccoglossus kowalevskii]